MSEVERVTKLLEAFEEEFAESSRILRRRLGILIEGIREIKEPERTGTLLLSSDEIETVRVWLSGHHTIRYPYGIRDEDGSYVLVRYLGMQEKDAGRYVPMLSHYVASHDEATIWLAQMVDHDSDREEEYVVVGTFRDNLLCIA